MDFLRIQKGIRKRQVHWRSNRQIKAMASSVAHNIQPSNDYPIIFFNASTRLEALSLNAAFSMLVGWSLRLKGVKVIHIVCQAGLKPCVLATHHDDPQAEPPCRSCIKQSQAVYYGGEQRSLHFHLDLELDQTLKPMGIRELLEFSIQDIPLGELVLPSLRWILRRHHLADDENTRIIYRKYILSAWSLLWQFEKILNDTSPQAVVVFNGMFYPEAVARWVAHRHGIRVITHEVGLRPFTGYFTDGDATAYPIDIPEDFNLSDEQNTRLDRYLQDRFQGNFSMAGIRFWPEMRGIHPEFWQKIQGYRQMVSVFTNVIFDTSQGHANVVFEHMFAWLDVVLELSRNHPETFFVIRAHPDESRPGKESWESVADWANRNKVELLENVLFVGPNELFSSYELIQHSKFVMVYNSTIGLEASLMGAAVLCAGKARFTQIPTVFFPQSVDEYRSMANDFLSIEEIHVPEQYITNARRFLYYQLYRASLPFDRFIEEDGIWRGYVKLRLFGWQDLLPEKSPTFETVFKGITRGESFLLME